MAKARVILDKVKVALALNSIRDVGDELYRIGRDDVTKIGASGLAFLRDTFPKSEGPRNTAFEDGSDRRKSRGPALVGGWRVYQTSATGEPGFVIKHARQRDQRITTILASLDQGSRAYTIELQRSNFFRFIDKDNALAINAGKPVDKIRIPARGPKPGPGGYITPTVAYIQDQMDFLRFQRAVEIEGNFGKVNKAARLDMIRLARARAIATSISP